MRYLLIENKEENELLYDVADFLWDNGNEVFIRNKSTNESLVKDYDCTVLLDYEDGFTESVFEKSKENLEKYFSITKNIDEKTILLFFKDGVYSNAIPFPHKIFHFNNLNKDSLSKFFKWCMKLNLFVKVNH